jgi:hypothetical protein
LEKRIALVLFTVFMMMVCITVLPLSAAEGGTSVYGDAAETEPVPDRESGFAGVIEDHTSFRLDVLGFGILRGPVDDSRLNDGNRLGISTWQKELSVRPDISMDLDRLYLSVKPRGSVVYQKWTKGPLDGQSDTETDLFVNEWLARVRVTDDLFVSYGRENLQWGPSYLISPSNPFIRDNGRDSPKTEVGGLDFARLVWVPHYNWSASFIANFDDGAYDFFTEFNRKYAVKIDYTGFEKYGSVILSHEESGHDALGFYAGWSVSDALLVYGEGSVRIDNPEADNYLDPDALVGLSYTFETGPTLACEYFYNDQGQTGPIHEAFPPFGNANPDDILIRKHYGLLQLSDHDVKDVFNYVLRWILDMDDKSSRFIGMIEYEMGDHWKLFGIGDVFNGSTDDEFGSLNDYSIYAGLQWSY